MAIERPFPLSSIGEIRGFFDLLLPGVFVLLHIWLVAYCITSGNTHKDITDIAGSPGLMVAIAVPSGYLLGLVLRMIRTGFADGWSIRFLLRFNHGCRFHGVPVRKKSKDNERPLSGEDRAREADRIKESKDKVLKGQIPSS